MIKRKDSLKKPFVSIIVPVKNINKNIKKSLIPALKKQTFKNFELIIITDKLLKKGPALKRDLGVKKARGDIIAFIDDDAYPDKNWLKNALTYFKNPKIGAVCGPGLLPSNNNWKSKVSDFVWQSKLGAGGAGTYRSQKEKKRFLDDYPSFNLIVKKKDFLKAGGFKTHFWPGEDTKLCHYLVYQQNKKIVYDPRVFVYHQRRPIFIPHLKQISRFGTHRGHFARILPQTSFRLRYLIPSIFALYLITLILLIKSIDLNTFYLVFLFPLFLYCFLLLLTFIKVLFKSKNILIPLFLLPAIFLTHLTFGIAFIIGYFSLKLKQ
ncbi:hypothetical protein COT75_05065 [Candidatus Beckwithbacteria bacterium CG10_big_fil_rev_8_21_14_0_10_34_10]|uniref:Glycosyltransferase 2-like domain-containing protein n=1 Tax=Candidatus Beckwithbacteria bacterium CG10_big_fil_rev_8_21_14_0_10_34_10 TaxID=1974495 RepID=A0A2H0W827_9BACT|nr:MAG: hypothetical protein COT75_05065 [Candidatus Beckwithbacteria bacterium CG10_big_fil_rev_8_21_14_0_10_34_10]